MKAAVLAEYNKFEIQQVPQPVVNSSQVLIKTMYAGICGSDMHIYKGDFHPRSPVPFIPGHEFAGIVVETGKDVTGLKVNDRVTVDPIIWCGKCAACERKHYPACTSLKLIGIDMDGGFGEYVAVNESMVFKLEDTISDIHAALIEVLSIGFHACRRAGVQKDDTIVIWGSGRVGHCILQAARTKTENTIYMIDIVDSRLELASKNYDNIMTINPKTENPVAVIKEHTHGRGVDIAFEAVGHAQEVAGSPHPVRGCIQSIRGAGTVCTLGLADEPAAIVFKELIWKEAKIVSSRVTHGEFPETIRHLSEGNLKPDILISAIFSLEDVQKAFDAIERGPQDYLKVLLKIG